MFHELGLGSQASGYACSAQHFSNGRRGLQSGGLFVQTAVVRSG